MNDFKLRKIQKHPKQPLLSDTAKSYLTKGVGIVLFLFLVYYAGAALINQISGLRIIQFLTSIVGKPLNQDDRGHTNVLLLGVGGIGHDGDDLTDTMMIVSIDRAHNHISLFSIPRDLYVQSIIGGSRINSIYQESKRKWGQSQALDFVRENVSRILDIPLHYAIKVDFKAFEKIIDAIGGVDVYVDESISDPEYPKGETFGFELFSLSKGLAHLDGETALKYARSRKTTSDFARSKRQHKLLVALKEKIKSLSGGERSSLLKELYYSLQEHVETNLSIREMLSLIDFAVSWDSQNLRSTTLNDDPLSMGGFLYTPDRALFGGAFVLIPAGDEFLSVNRFVQFILYGPQEIIKTPIIILNGTGKPGLASLAKTAFTRYGFHVMKTGNAEDIKLNKTTWYLHNDAQKEVLELMQELVPGEVTTTIPAAYQTNPDITNDSIVLEIGADSISIIQKLDIFTLVPIIKPSTPATEISAPTPAGATATIPAPTIK